MLIYTEYKSAWYTEIILRRLLLVRKPDPVAIITFNADYTAGGWEEPRNEKYRKSLSQYSPEPTKLWINALYEIPVISASLFMLSLASKEGAASQFDPKNEYSTKSWHSDRCCHPRHNGHLILNLILAYNFVEEEKVMIQHQNSSDLANVERDLSADKSLLRDPLYLSPEEENMYVRTGMMSNASQDNVLDFTDPNGESIWKEKVILNEGWTWFADNKDNDKYGFIANNITGGQHIAFSITGGDHGLVEVSVFIHAYDSLFEAVLALTLSSNSSTT